MLGCDDARFAAIQAIAERCHQRTDFCSARSLLRDDDGVAFGFNARVAHRPCHQGLTAVNQGLVGKLALCGLDSTGKLPVLGNADDSLFGNADLVKRIDDGADAIGVERDSRSDPFFVYLLGRLAGPRCGEPLT
jgi:hypothetical protein